MATKTIRKGSWRKVAPSVYEKAVGAYGEVSYGARVLVSFVGTPRAQVVDVAGIVCHTLTGKEANKYIAAAKKAYSKDLTAIASKTKARSRVTTQSCPEKWVPVNLAKLSGSGGTRRKISDEEFTLGHLGASGTAIRQEMVEFGAERKKKLQQARSAKPGAKAASKARKQLRQRIEDREARLRKLGV